ncbi:OX-2 membrane glycoprotein-like isoform X1 [Cebidichthys violaceus]|uniref:OX-2 membrane glycoprotein-like isoform X1 n=1 Tax=Cebidichthys violaceus TaxID=271503 RepID=UPI0035CACFB1
MSHRAVIHFLCALGVFHKGQTALIESQRSVLAAVGDNVRLNCQLMQSKDVVQVTWQKISPEGETDLATYNKDFGQKVNSGFQGRVEFKDAGLQNSSIVIRNVTDQDKGCYRCLFNTYPDGALTGRTCLQLYELHEPFLHVREPNSAEEVLVSCSATGRPAPTVTLTVPHYNSTSVTNTNGTVTVTTTAVLSRLSDNSSRVGCAVRVLSGPQIEVYAVVPEVRQSSADGFDVESGSDNDFNFTWVIGLVVVVLCVCAAAAAAAAAAVITIYKQKHQNRQNPRGNTCSTKAFLESVSVSQRDNEDNKKDTHEPRTPLMKNENKLRQRSTGKSVTTVTNQNGLCKEENLISVPQNNPQD